MTGSTYQESAEFMREHVQVIHVGSELPVYVSPSGARVFLTGQGFEVWAAKACIGTSHAKHSARVIADGWTP